MPCVISNSAVALTVNGDGMACELHNRMPVILDPEDYDWWLTGKKSDSY